MSEIEYQPFDDAIEAQYKINPVIDVSKYDRDAEIYIYPHHEIFEAEDDTILQTRSGPNWQGPVMTLTTCKQFMRTWKKEPKDWEGTWFCGLINGCRKILYLAMVHKGFASNYDLGHHISHTYGPEGFRAKSASWCPMGDLYVPKGVLEGDDRYDPDNFMLPLANHTRRRETYSDGTPKWWKDIRFRNPQGRPPTTMLFNSLTVHLWTQWSKAPEGKQFSTGRSGCKMTLGEFEDMLV
jgi:hypothetical protein